MIVRIFHLSKECNDHFIKSPVLVLLNKNTTDLIIYYKNLNCEGDSDESVYFLPILLLVIALVSTHNFVLWKNSENLKGLQPTFNLDTLVLIHCY